MNSFPAILTTIVAAVLASLLGVGAASISHHQGHAAPEPRATAVTASSVPTVPIAADPVPAAPAAADPGTLASVLGRGPGILTGFPHQVHRDERLIEEEHELTQAAPHTLWRFDAGTA